MNTQINLTPILESADRRTLAAVVTHLANDPKAVPDLRDRARIEELAARLLPPLTGRNGVDVRTQLDERLETYQGMALAHCPNLFISPGPNGTPGHGGSGIFFAECQVGYIVECLRAMFEHKWARLEVREEAVRAFVDEVSAELEHYVWSLPGISNWFRGSRDRVTAIIPKRLIDLWQESKAPKLDDYIGA